MPSRSLDPDVALGIKIGAVMTRNRYEQDDVQRVVDELYATAGDRLDLLAEEVGLFIGFYEDQDTITLTTALRKLPLDMADAIALGEYRRDLPMHGAPPPSHPTK